MNRVVLELLIGQRVLDMRSSAFESEQIDPHASQFEKLTVHVRHVDMDRPGSLIQGERKPDGALE